jgi:hypothetical protein
MAQSDKTYYVLVFYDPIDRCWNTNIDLPLNLGEFSKQRPPRFWCIEVPASAVLFNPSCYHGE